MGTVEVNQKQKLYRMGGYICIDLENTFKGFPGSHNMTVFTFHRISASEENPDLTRVEIYVYVEIGSLFLGRGHAVREVMEDVQEYCSRFKLRIQTGVLAGVDSTGESTIQRLTNTKEEIEKLQNISTQNAAAKGDARITKFVLLFVIFLQLLALFQVIFS